MIKVYEVNNNASPAYQRILIACTDLLTDLTYLPYVLETACNISNGLRTY